jgi:hypothetical protein
MSLLDPSPPKAPVIRSKTNHGGEEDPHRQAQGKLSSALVRRPCPQLLDGVASADEASGAPWVRAGLRRLCWRENIRARNPKPRSLHLIRTRLQGCYQG